MWSTRHRSADTPAPPSRRRERAALIPGLRYNLSSDDLELGFRGQKLWAVRNGLELRESRTRWISDPAVRRFLENLIGRHFPLMPRPHGQSKDEPHVLFLNYIKARTMEHANGACCQRIWKLPTAGDEVRIPMVFNALATMVSTMTTDTSVEDLMKCLVRDNIFDESVLGSEELQKYAQYFIYFSIGCVTMLYASEMHGDSQVHEIDRIIELKDGDDQLCVSSDLAKQPFMDSIRALGVSLPLRQSARMQDDLLRTSNLNLASICHSGHLEIDWVLSIGQHAKLDKKRSRLALFAFPSLCELMPSDESLLARISTDIYEEWSRPAGFSFADYAAEIVRTYDLFFSTKRARAVYNSHERRRLIGMMGEELDTHLNALCNRSSTGRFFKETYSKTNDFPILSERLAELHQYIESQRPSGTRALWRDRRNLLTWYTFWAVLILGVLGLISTIIQTALGAVQTDYAYKSFHLQELSGSGQPQGASAQNLSLLLL